MLSKWINASYCVFNVLMSISFSPHYHTTLTKDDQNTTLSISLHNELPYVTRNHILIVASHQHATFCHQVIGRIDVQSVWRGLSNGVQQGILQEMISIIPLLLLLTAYSLWSPHAGSEMTRSWLSLWFVISSLSVCHPALLFFLSLSLAPSVGVYVVLWVCGCVWESVGFERQRWTHVLVASLTFRDHVSEWRSCGVRRVKLVNFDTRLWAVNWLQTIFTVLTF